MHFPDLLDRKLKLIWAALNEVLCDDITADLSLHKKKWKGIGFVVQNGVMCVQVPCEKGSNTVSALSQLVEEWLLTCVEKYECLKENGMCVYVCNQMIVVLEELSSDSCYRLDMSHAARGEDDIKRDFILLDFNGNVSFISMQQPGVFLQNEHWVRSRMYIVLEVKMEKKRAEG